MKCCHGHGHRYPESRQHVCGDVVNLLTEHHWKLLSVNKVQPVTKQEWIIVKWSQLFIVLQIDYLFTQKTLTLILNRHMENPNLFLVLSLQLSVALDALKALCILYTVEMHRSISNQLVLIGVLKIDHIKLIR